MGSYSLDLLFQFGITIQALLLESGALWESHSALNVLSSEMPTVLVEDPYLFWLQRRAWKHNPYQVSNTRRQTEIHNIYLFIY